MPVAGNPYRPGFAEQPPVLAGREDDLASPTRRSSIMSSTM